MTLSAYQGYFSRQLQQWYPAGEAEAIARVIWEDLAGMDAAALRRQADAPLVPTLQQNLDRALEQLRVHVPVQYVCGQAAFYGLRLKVNPAVLIPRPETEELVHWIIHDRQQQQPLSILDVGTGSGCIAIALKKNLPGALVTAVDASAAALEVAAENARACRTPLQLLQMDFLDAEARNALPQVHVIVSNPPYIPVAEAESLDPNVREYEPAAALFVPDEDPLLFYRALAVFAETHLLPGGALYAETHERYAEATAALFRSHFRTAEVRKDLNGKMRMVRALSS